MKSIRLNSILAVDPWHKEKKFAISIQFFFPMKKYGKNDKHSLLFNFKSKVNVARWTKTDIW